MSADVSEMVTISRAELDALQAELRRLRREVGRSIAASTQIWARAMMRGCSAVSSVSRPVDDPLLGAHELHLSADHVTIWYTVSMHQGHEIISIQLVCRAT